MTEKNEREKKANKIRHVCDREEKKRKNTGDEFLLFSSSSLLEKRKKRRKNTTHNFSLLYDRYKQKRTGEQARTRDNQLKKNTTFFFCRFSMVCLLKGVRETTTLCAATTARFPICCFSPVPSRCGRLKYKPWVNKGEGVGVSCGGGGLEGMWAALLLVSLVRRILPFALRV